MNQDSSFPPILPPSTELGALLFAVLPCLRETYRPLVSFAYHMTELTRLKSIPSVPPLTGLSGIETIIADKDILFRSLSFYGKMFRMPLLSSIASLLQGFQFYQTYKDILPGLFSGMGNSAGEPSSAFGNMTGLFSGLGGLGGFGNGNSSENTSPDLFSMLSGLSPELIASLFPGFSGGFSSQDTNPASSATETSAPDAPASAHADSMTAAPSPATSDESSPPADDFGNSLYSLLTPEQQKIYEQLMHTD